jgi:hypothetical protein
LERDHTVRDLATPSISKSRDVAFGSPDLRFVHPEVVRNLVPNCAGNHLLQLGRSSRYAFVWTLINRYPIRHGERLKDRTAGQRVTLVETEQARTGRLLLNDNGHVFEATAEALWNIAESRFNQAIEFGSGQHASSSYAILREDREAKNIICAEPEADIWLHDVKRGKGPGQVPSLVAVELKIEASRLQSQSTKRYRRGPFPMLRDLRADW